MERAKGRGGVVVLGIRLKRWQIVAAVVVVAVLTATAAWSWMVLREERAAQVKAHTVFVFTDQFGRPAAGYRVRLCTARLAWWSWLLPWRPSAIAQRDATKEGGALPGNLIRWHPFEVAQRDVTADARGEVHVTGRHRWIWLRELDRAQYVAPLRWSATTPAGEQIQWGYPHRPFEGRLVYGVLRRGKGDDTISESFGPHPIEVKVRGCGGQQGTTGILPLVIKGSGQEDGRLRFEAEAVTAMGRQPAEGSFFGWRVRVVGEGAQLLPDESAELLTFAPESGYADRFEIDSSSLGHPRAFVRTAHHWWYVEFAALYMSRDCAVTILPMSLRTNRNGANDLFDERWSHTFWPDPCLRDY